MPGFAITLARSARKELQSLPIDVAERLLKKIELLAVNARPAGSKKLSGSTNLWRLRVGDYRVIYKIDDSGHKVDVVIVRHRREVYRQHTERSDLLENAVAEAILDMKLGLAIEEGDTGEYADEKQIYSLLRD